MSVCATCYEPGITADGHDCLGPRYEDVVFTRHRGRGITVNTAPTHTRISLQVLTDRYAYLHMPEPGLIVLADQVVYQVTGYDATACALTLELAEDWRPKSQAQETTPGQVVPVEGNPAAVHEAMRQMDADPHGIEAGMVVQSYREYGQEKWVFRCWGTDDGCEGLLSLDHGSRQSAERARDRHVAEEHGEKQS